MLGGPRGAFSGDGCVLATLHRDRLDRIIVIAGIAAS
jgi:hypothetical protein